MSRKRHCTLIGVVMLLAIGARTPAWPYDSATHQAINDGAAVRSSLNDYLVTVLGFPDGIITRFNGRNVREWMREGGVLEDQPVTRAANHFHYPLREWDRALLTDAPGSAFAIQSSVLWAQNPNQDPILGPADTWSWIRARREFLEALTNSSATKREEAFGNTFRALGQVLHLVADGSVPAHARNDSHVTGEPFETWLENQARRRPGESPEDAAARFLATFAPTSVTFSPAVLGTTPNPLAPIPIAKVFDADAYNGTAETLGLTGGNAVGIAEVSNANFFSGSTIFADSFGTTHQRYSPFPASTAVEQFIDPNTNRRYWRKTSPGVTVEHLATVSRLDFFRQPLGGGPPATGGLDPVVHGEYARHLIPRAVGYTAGLLDYFFRGRLQASFAPGPNGGREVILQTQNVTGEPIGRGTLLLLYDDDSGERHLIQQQDVKDLGDASELPALQFDVPAGPLSQYVVVYRGRLGGEPDAVVARVLSESPIVAVQELAALTGAESEKVNPFLGGSGGRELRKDPNQQRAAGYFWAGGAAGVGSKIREVRVEEGTEGGAFLGRFPPKAVLRINGKDVGTHWQAADDPSLIPERWEVILTPIPGQTSEIGVVPPSAIWVNDFRTPLLWVNSVTSATGQFTFLQGEGVPVWITTKVQFTLFHFGDGVRGSDPKSGTPLTPARTGVSFRPVGEAAGGPVPRAELAFLPESCGTNGPLYRFAFAFASRSLNFLIFPSACGVVSPAGWAKNLLWLQERVLTLGAQPDPAPPPLLTVATFRREFLDADLERFLSVGMVPPMYDIQILSEGGAILGL